MAGPTTAVDLEPAMVLALDFLAVGLGMALVTDLVIQTTTMILGPMAMAMAVDMRGKSCSRDSLLGQFQPPADRR